MRSPESRTTARPDIDSAIGRASDDVIDPEQRRDQTSAERRREGEDIDEFLRQRIGRRPDDHRRVFRLPIDETGIEDNQQHKASHREHESEEQFAPAQQPQMQFGKTGQGGAPSASARTSQIR